MDFIIKPYESAGPVKLGMTKEQVRAAIHEVPQDDHYFRGPYTDFYSEACVFVYYTEENGVCEAIEFGDPTRAVYSGELLNGIPFIEAKKLLEKYDNELDEEVGVGVTSYKLGIGLYAPNYDLEEDPGAHVEAVILFRKGYYD